MAIQKSSNLLHNVNGIFEALGGSLPPNYTTSLQIEAAGQY